MNYSLIILLAVVLLASGCIGGNNSIPVSPTPTILITPTPPTVPQDPIIGVWRNDSDNIDFRVRFNSEKTFVSSTSYKDNLRRQYGSWEPQDRTSYLISIYTLPSISEMLIYDPERDVIYSKETVLTRYPGDIISSIVSSPTPTPFS
jgi:hypothetical protein